MAKIIAGIISYMGHSKETQEKRLEVHNQQLDWFKQQKFTKKDLWIVSQKYQKDWYRKKDATYYDAWFEEAKLKPGAARNYLLRMFYDSDADWIILADNDSILDERNKGDIIDWLRNNDQDQVHCFVPVAPNVPGQGAWKEYFEQKTALEDYWVFERGKTKTSFMFLKNLKKHYGFELFFDEGERFLSGEDWAFGIELIQAGFRAMWCRNIVLKEMGGMKHSGTWKPEGDSKGHAEYQPLLRESFAREFGDLGVEDTGELSMRRFYQKFPQTNQDIWVKKSEDEGLFSF